LLSLTLTPKMSSYDDLENRTEEDLPLVPVNYQPSRSQDGMVLIRHSDCPRVSSERIVRLGLRKKEGVQGRVSVNSHNISHILGRMEMFLRTCSLDILHLFWETVPDEFVMDHPCWGCWIKYHFDGLDDGYDIEDSCVYGKGILCNCDDIKFRFLLMTFASLYLTSTLELVCTDGNDGWCVSVYSCARKWYEDDESS
jgi:hypothetical protein